MIMLPHHFLTTENKRKMTKVNLNKILQSQNAKPYHKLNMLIEAAHQEGLLTREQAFDYCEELNLLLNGINESHNKIKRTFINP